MFILLMSVGKMSAQAPSYFIFDVELLNPDGSEYNQDLEFCRDADYKLKFSNYTEQFPTGNQDELEVIRVDIKSAVTNVVGDCYMTYQNYPTPNKGIGGHYLQIGTKTMIYSKDFFPLQGFSDYHDYDESDDDGYESIDFDDKFMELPFGIKRSSGSAFSINVDVELAIKVRVKGGIEEIYPATISKQFDFYKQNSKFKYLSANGNISALHTVSSSYPFGFPLATPLVSGSIQQSLIVSDKLVIDEDYEFGNNTEIIMLGTNSEIIVPSSKTLSLTNCNIHGCTADYWKEIRVSGTIITNNTEIRDANIGISFRGKGFGKINYTKFINERVSGLYKEGGKSFIAVANSTFVTDKIRREKMYSGIALASDASLYYNYNNNFSNIENGIISSFDSYSFLSVQDCKFENILKNNTSITPFGFVSSGNGIYFRNNSNNFGELGIFNSNISATLGLNTNVEDVDIRAGSFISSFDASHAANFRILSSLIGDGYLHSSKLRRLLVKDNSIGSFQMDDNYALGDAKIIDNINIGRLTLKNQSNGPFKIYNNSFVGSGVPFLLGVSESENVDVVSNIFETKGFDINGETDCDDLPDINSAEIKAILLEGGQNNNIECNSLSSYADYFNCISNDGSLASFYYQPQGVVTSNSTNTTIANNEIDGFEKCSNFLGTNNLMTNKISRNVLWANNGRNDLEVGSINGNLSYTGKQEFTENIFYSGGSTVEHYSDDSKIYKQSEFLVDKDKMIQIPELYPKNIKPTDDWFNKTLNGNSKPIICKETRYSRVSGFDRELMQDEVEIPYYEVESKWNIKYNIYRGLKTNYIIESDDDVTNNFLAKQTKSAIGTLYEIDKAIKTSLAFDYEQKSFVAHKKGHITENKDSIVSISKQIMLEKNKEKINNYFQKSEPFIQEIANTESELIDFQKKFDSVFHTSINELITLNQNINDEGLQSIKNHKKLNAIKLGHLIDNKDYTQVEVKQIKTIANQCPFGFGNAVYEARGMYAHVNNKAVYNDTLLCKNGISHRESTKELTKSSINIYPNPASNQITINAVLQKGNQILIFDMLNRELMRSVVSENTDSELINTEKLVSGTYIISILKDEKIVSYQKISIIK